MTLVLSYSYQDLDPADQTRFRALGALAYNQPFDQLMLDALWQLDDEGELETACDTLRLLSLLELDYTYTGPDNESDQNSWYRLHLLLQTYARALFHATEEAEGITSRYQQYVVVTLTKKFWELPPEEWGRQITPYLPHIHGVGNILVQEWKNQTTTNTKVATEAWLKMAQLFAINTSPYLALRREVHQQDWLELGLAVSQSLQDQKQQARFLNELGGVYSALGEKAKALEYYNQALPIMQAVGDRSSEAAILNNMGLVYSALGDKSQALDYYNQVLSILRAVGNRNVEAITCYNIGMLYRNLGDLAQAVHYVALCVQLDQEISHPDLESDIATLAALQKELAVQKPT